MTHPHHISRPLCETLVMQVTTWWTSLPVAVKLRAAASVACTGPASRQCLANRYQSPTLPTSWKPRASRYRTSVDRTGRTSPHPAAVQPVGPHALQALG
jgi:hypothetical protein